VHGDGSNAVPIRIIVVPSQQEADALVDQLRKGADFAHLAREKSVDSTASDGGYVGEMDPTSLRAELKEAMIGLRPGVVTNPVKLPAGYAILEVLDKPPAGAAIGPNSTGALPIAARGTVRYSTQISGYAETLLAQREQLRSIAGWEQNLHAGCEAYQEGVPRAVDRVRAMAAEAGQPMDQKVFEIYTLGQMLASNGKMDEAIQQWESAHETATANALPVAQRLQVVLGTAYLQRASINDFTTEHGIDRSRLFPAMPGALHPRPADVQKAIGFFLDVLHQDPTNLEIRWLLNVCYMTAGTYPDKVPPEFLLSADKFSSKQDIGRFLDIAPEVGINISTAAGGIIVDDFDNDGLLDIVTSQIDDCAPLHFFHNNGNGTFSDRTEAAGLANQFGGLNIIQADYNNDGCVDILVLRGGWEFPRRLSLLRNNCSPMGKPSFENPQGTVIAVVPN